MQIDSFMELPKDKRPPENIWDKPEEIDRWFDSVYDRDKNDEFELIISDNDIEGA